MTGFQLEKSKVEELVQESVDEFVISLGCNDGDGMAGSLHSIKVTTSSKKVLHLIYKAIDKSDPTRTQQMVDNGFFEVEVLVYSKLLPMLAQIGSVGSSEVLESLSTPAPKLVHYYTGDNPADTYICMEDVRPSGFRMTDKYSGLFLEETTLVIKEMAKFHALTYSLIRYEGDKIFFNELASLDKFRNDKEVMKIFEPFFFAINGSVLNAIELMKTRNPKLHSLMEAHFAGTTSPAAALNPQIQFPSALNTDVNAFPVIIHGDLWSNNILFKYTDETRQNPIALKFVDFQLTRRGNIYEDLGYFLFTSTTPDFRSKHLPLVLNIYYDSFVQTLQQLNVPRPIGFTEGSFIDSYQKVIPFVFRHMCFAIPLQLGTPLPEVAKMLQQHEVPQVQNNLPPAEVSPLDTMKQLNQLMRIQMETNTRAMDRFEALAQEMAHLKVI